MTERIDRRAVTQLLLGLCSLIGSGIFFASVPATLSEARAVADANVCPDSARRNADCLVRETGRLSGPYSTRRDRDPGDDWVFQPGGSIERERFALAPLASQRAEYLPDTVRVLRWHGETVALETENGQRIETENFRGSVANQFYLGLMTLGAGGMFITSGFVVRRSADGWTVRPAPRDPTYARRETPLPMQVALVVAAAGGAGMFTIAMGGSTSLSITIALIGASLGGAMSARTRLRRRRQPCSDTR
jgi:hypothetical protein